MTLSRSAEDYLEAILILRQTKGTVRSADLARYMGYSKASISHAVKKLRTDGFLLIGENKYLCLTDQGRAAAEKIYERHQFFMEQLIAAGVDRETAKQDACQIKHAISDISFQKLKEKVQHVDVYFQ